MNILNIFSQIHFIDIVDIIIVALIFYWLFNLIKGTKAVQMSIGLAIIIIATFISQRLQLQTITWLLKNLWTIWIIIFIIVFQTELQSALARLGTGKLFGYYFSDKTFLIDEIIKSVIYLTSQKYGALIVIERDVGLKSLIETGTKINAYISSELINTIFTPNTPLHDGAIIIQHNDIASAASILPLSKDPHIPKQFGTRHRAAIGLTEETDAIVIVLSEETGNISLVKGGIISQGIDTLSLKKSLEEILLPKRESFSWGKKKK
ncbi:MAG: diadenylate cyclase CdaA [bacterium]